MDERAVEVVKLFQSIDWFWATGSKSTDQVVVLDSWWDAGYVCKESRWYAVHVKAHDPLMNRLMVYEKERHRLWNDIVEEIKTIITPIVSYKIVPLLVDEPLTKDIINSIEYDLIMIAMCAEYADVYLPPFYVDLACWYIKGHFPCGWEGTYPEGRLIVF